MMFWQLNTRAAQTVDDLRGALERERDDFLTRQRPDTVQREYTEALIKASGPARDSIEKALNDYIAKRPNDSQQQRVRIQMDGAISGAVMLAEAMTKGLRNALVQATLCGHVDDDRTDGIDQRMAVSIDFAPMPRVARETTT